MTSPSQPVELAPPPRATPARWLASASDRAQLAAMVACAFLIRAVVVAFAYRGDASPLNHFGDFGAEMGWVARSLAQGHGFSSPFFPVTGPTALVPPLYPYLMACVFRLFGLYSAASAVVLLLLGSLFSALACIPIYLCVRDAAGPRHARLASWLWVVYPFAINYSASEIWDYAPTSLLFAWCFYLAQRLPARRPLAWLGFGLFYGLTALSNPSILSALPFLFLIALWRAHRAGRPWLLRASLSVLGVLLMVAPWTLRNYRVLHAPVPIRDGFWLEFYAGNHGDTSTSNPPDAHPATNPVEMDKFSAMGESAYLAGTHDLAMRYVHQHPLAFASISMRRALRFWTGFWSFSPAYIRSQPLDVPNLFFCTCVTLFMLRGLLRWWRHDAGRALPYLAVIAVFPIPYYLTHSSMDYRQPIEPLVIMLVAIGILGFGARIPAAD